MKLPIIGCVTLSLLLEVSQFITAQELFEAPWVSSDCDDAYGEPQMCYPPFTSVIADRTVTATNTCGERKRQKYCIHMSNSGMASRCQYCDSRNPAESHIPEYMTDKNPHNWWQSETMADNSLLHFRESVNLTVDLGTQFHVNYIYLQFRSPRPHAMVIYKRFDEQSDWQPWAYFSSNCYTYFGMQYHEVPVFTLPDQVICQQEYSTLQPMYEGEVIFSVIKGRPNYDRFFNDRTLQRWSTASQIRIELKKIHTFGDERGAEVDTLLTYYFAIQKFTVGGRCLCHGHGNECRRSSGPGRPNKLVCVCAESHHTTGDNCEQCTPDHRDAPWKPATPMDSNPCQPCKCNGNSQLCEFDAALYEKTGSGSRCIGCANNTEGINCERCKPYFFTDSDSPTVCLPCACDPIGTVGGHATCNAQGQCPCKPGVGGNRCDRCLDNYFGFSSGGCQQCNCSEVGGYDDRALCDQTNGQCICKQNVFGKQCDKCKLGHYGLMANDPLGCKPCHCSLHSSECELDVAALESKHGSSDLNALVKPDTAVINCPPGQESCFACLRKDRKGIQLNCNGTAEGYIPCLCETDPHKCPYCSSGWRVGQPDPRSELCRCPAQYTDNSCEHCIEGYRREPLNGLPTDRCIPCTCNGHATKCHPETGQCECMDNTNGLFCDRCVNGYYGNATAPVGSVEACKPCPCPEGAWCEEIMWPDRTTEVVCKDCADNRAGHRCERCAENYFGDPTNGIPCQPCDCSNNVDPREFGNCDIHTGECLKCLFGTTGRHCEKCLPGYKRNFKPANESALLQPGSVNISVGLIPARGCSPCYCDPVGTQVSYDANGVGVCNPETGQCPCKPGVGGLQCPECYAGFYGFHTGQGCQPCDCDSLGAVGEACDDRSGRCECRPYVTGRQCTKCRSGFFNLTSLHGCQDCHCHVFGSEDLQCNSQGHCKCKPFAVSDKCNKCKENHYDLAAGCLPCPACYNLVQARVAKLWGMLESVFGPMKPGVLPGITPPPIDDKDLYVEMAKLNHSIVLLYRKILTIGENSSVFNSEQLAKTIEQLALQVSKVKVDTDALRMTQPTCASMLQLDEQLQQLEKTIDKELFTLLDIGLVKALEQLRNRTAVDSVLTTQVNELGDLEKRLKSQSDKLKADTNELGFLLSNATSKLVTTEAEILQSQQLYQDQQKLGNKLTANNQQLTNDIETVKKVLQKTSDHVYQTGNNINQLPDIQDQLRLLQSVMNKWQQSANTSRELQRRLNDLSKEVGTAVNQLRVMSDQLANQLAKKNQEIGDLLPHFDRLNHLLLRVEMARNTSWKAFTSAQQKLEYLKDFHQFVTDTKKLATAAMEKYDQLTSKLTDIEMRVKDLHDQAVQELTAAERLNNRSLELGQVLKQLEADIDKADKAKDKYKERLYDLNSRHNLEVVHEVSQAKEAVNKVDENARTVIEAVDANHAQVGKMKEEVQNLLDRMKRLKDQLTETGTGGYKPVNGEDAATRFNRLKAAIKVARLESRLSVLRDFNQSRSTELAYLRNELEEFKAHYSHLVKVDSLLPLTERTCFYKGKGIEGDNRLRRAYEG